MSAYYSRNDSYSRSFNAECAESEGRLPRSRAAAHLGMSVAAFDAGCRAAGYRSTEWHHVGKYANEVSYYDTVLLAETPAFWEGAASAYKSAAKQQELLGEYTRRIEAERQATKDAFRQKLISQRECTRPVRTHSAWLKWHDRCYRVGARPASSGDETKKLCDTWYIAVGDLATLRLAAAEQAARKAEAEAKRLAVAESIAEFDRLAAGLPMVASEVSDFHYGRRAAGCVLFRPHSARENGVNFWTPRRKRGYDMVTLSPIDAAKRLADLLYS